MTDKYDPVPDLALLLVAGIAWPSDTPVYAGRIAERLGLGEDDSPETVAGVLREALGLAGTCGLVTARSGTPCTHPAVTRLTATCPHGHVTERQVCEDHRTPGKSLWCRACYRAPDGHECPVVLAPAAGLSDSQRFQVEEARDCLGTWDMANPGGVSRETVLADQVRHLLAIVDQAFPAEARGQVSG